MWAKLKSLFSKETTAADTPLSVDFEEQVEKAILLIDKEKGILQDKEFVNLLVRSGIGHKAAVEILIFLPIAFTRRLLSTVEWPDTYMEEVGKNQRIKKFDETESFKKIWKVTIDYFDTSPSNDTILKIAGRSAEFDAVNQLLTNQPSSKPEDIQIGLSVIMR
jgi:hypothetical protein